LNSRDASWHTSSRAGYKRLQLRLMRDLLFALSSYKLLELRLMRDAVFALGPYKQL
jgi:hypothetical protein